MKSYLVRIIVLLIAFALGIAVTMAGRFIRSGGVERIGYPDQKPFVLVIKKRVTASELNTACH